MSEQAKHTPGPWKWQKVVGPITGPRYVTEWTLEGPDALCRFWYDKPPSADAYLIAAAPDMLAALGPMRIALQKQVDLLRFQARNSTAGLSRTLIETAEGWQALCHNAEAAIAKATGETQ